MVGGEPTLWPRLKDFLANKPKNMFVLVSTNGSRTINWWEKNLQYFDGVCATFHPDSASADHFFELGRLFSQYPDKALEIILLVYDQVRDKVMDLYNRLEETDWKINVRIKIVDDRHIENTQDNLDIIYRSAKDSAVNETLNSGFFIRNDNFYKIGKETEVYVDDKLITMHDAYLMPHRGQTNFQGWKCSAGRNSLYIWSDGSIYRGSCMNGGVIGNINIDTSLNIEPWTTCEKLKCFCMDEVLLEKFKP
jgi:MoaA/NifB/PqqE/SkfB family radical SAM enzyme